MDCDVVYPVEREVVKTPARALEELFKGRQDEINQSFLRQSTKVSQFRS